MNKVLKELALWKKGLSPFERKEFEKGLFDRVYRVLNKKRKNRDIAKEH